MLSGAQKNKGKKKLQNADLLFYPQFV
jgi:hypothetical protein